MPGPRCGCPCAAQPRPDVGYERWQALGFCNAFSLPHPPGFLMSLVFSSNHSSYNTGLGEAKNSSPSHMTAPNAEAPSKGTSATPCFLGNESHRDAWAAAETNAARAYQTAHCFLPQPCCDRRRVRGGRAGYHLRVGRSTAWGPGVQKPLLPFRSEGSGR